MYRSRRLYTSWNNDFLASNIQIFIPIRNLNAITRYDMLFSLVVTSLDRFCRLTLLSNASFAFKKPSRHLIYRDVN